MTEPKTMFSINPDSFIFAVNQAFEARSKKPGEFNSHLRYEPFLLGSWSVPESREFTTFKFYLAEIISHHFQVLPQYRKNETVNLENISWFAHSIAALFADINFLVNSYTGSSLPNLAEASIPKANSSKNIILAIKKYSSYLQNENKSEEFSLFPLLSEVHENVPQDKFYTHEIWSLISSFLKRTFGTYYDLISPYIVWKFSPKVIEEEAVDWNVRPPCGAAYNKQFKEFLDIERKNFRDQKFNKRNDSKGEHKSEHKHTPKFEAKHEAKHEPKHEPMIKAKQIDVPQTEEDKHTRKPSHHSAHTEVQSEKRDYSQKKPFKNHAPSHNGHDSFQNAEAINQKNMEEAIRETKKAIQQMIKNKQIPEISLQPQNSFIRRQQHVVIAEAGFETESRGDARDRHVCVKRKV